MSGEAWLYLFAFIINAVNLFLQVFFTIMYSDLEWYAFSLDGVKRRVGMEGGSLAGPHLRIAGLRRRCCLD